MHDTRLILWNLYLNYSYVYFYAPTFSSIKAAMGKQLKQSVNVFHNLMENRRLPEKTFFYVKEMNCGVASVLNIQCLYSHI